MTCALMGDRTFQMEGPTIQNPLPSCLVVKQLHGTKSQPVLQSKASNMFQHIHIVHIKHMCVYMRSMYVHMDVCLHACMLVCMYIWRCVRMYVCVIVYVYLGLIFVNLMLVHCCGIISLHKYALKFIWFLFFYSSPS